MTLSPTFVPQDLIAARMDELRKEVEAKEQKRKAAEAERAQCQKREVVGAYFTAVCVASGLQDSEPTMAPAALRTAEAERERLSSCPADVLDLAKRKGQMSGYASASKVSRLVVFSEGLAKLCREAAVKALP